jgi:PAS domain S-box-containing protein
MYFLPIIQDITERKKAEATLKRSEERYREAQKMGRAGHWEFDPTSREFSGSPEALRIYGFPDNAQVSFEDIANCVSKREVERVVQALFSCIQGGKEFNEEFEICPRNSSETRVLWSVAQMQKDEKGGPGILSGILQDITERKKAEAELSQERLLVATLLESLPGIFYLQEFDPMPIVVRWNKNTEKVTGYTSQEMFRRPATDFLSPETQERAMKAIQKAMEEGYGQTETGLVTKDGRTIPYIMTAAGLEVSGKPCFVGVGIDITERKQAEEALQAETANLYAIFESSPVAMFVVDETTNIVMTNQAFTVMCGGSEADILQHRPGNALRCVHSHKDPRGCGYAAECKFCNVRKGVEGLIANGGTIHGAELVLELIRNGTPQKVWMSVGAESMQLNGRMHVCVAMDDITERKRAEGKIALNSQRMQTLLKLNQMTEATLKEITDFVLEEAVRLTQSKLGYLAFLNEDESVLTMHSWSHSAMAECAIQDKPIIYPVASTGLWGEAVRQRRPVITNDYTAANPLKKGYPQGHVAVKSHMNVPVFVGSRIVIVAGVGNKAEEYVQEDVEQLTLLMEGMWRLIERKTAEEALRESEEGYRTTLMSVGDGVITTDAEGRVRLLNPVAETLTGWSQEDARGRPLKEVFRIVNEETRKEVEDPVSRVVREGMVVGLANHTLLIARDGKEHPIADSGAPIRDAGGALTGVVLVFRDQTTERAADRALRESSAKFRDTVKYLDEGYYSCTMEGLVLDHNLAFNRILGIDLNRDMKGAKLPDFWQDPEDRKVYLKKFMATSSINTYPINAKKSNGEKIVVLASSHLVKDEKGKPVRIDGTFLDITDRKRAEEALRLKNIVFDASIAANSIADMNGTITEANDAFLRVWGYPSKDEVIGKPLPQFINDQKEAIAIVTALNSTGQWEGDYTAKRKDGSTFVAYGLATTVKDEKGTVIGYQSAVMDVTGQREAEKEIKKLNESLERRVRERTDELQASNRELESFAYSVSHDLRAPLRIIDGFSHALLEDYDDKLDVQGKDYLRRVRASTQMMALLIDDMLKLSRITRTEMNIEKVNLTRIARSVIDELQKSQPERLINIKIADGLEDTADARLMRVALENLLGNAWKFTGKQAEAVIEFGATKEGERKVYFIRDNGAGFDMAYVDKLFAPFQRLHTMEEYPGTGIGLATVRRIIQRHGGKAWAEGQAGKGATFYFSLQG